MRAVQRYYQNTNIHLVASRHSQSFDSNSLSLHFVMVEPIDKLPAFYKAHNNEVLNITVK